MPNAYVPVPAAAFEEFTTRGFRTGRERDEVTLVQESARIPGLRLVIYTSLSAGAAAARSVGSDAIRIALVAVGRDGRTRGVRAFPRVNRVGSVEALIARIRGRISDARLYARDELVTCGCGAPAYRDSGRCAARCGRVTR